MQTTQKQPQSQPKTEPRRHESVTNLGDETIQHLQALIKVNIDSVKGLEKAAKEVEQDKLQSLFRELATERAGFAHQLKTYVRVNEEEPIQTGSWAGQLHRWWMDTKETLAKDGETALLEEAEKGEDTIKEMYETVLKETAGSPVNDVLQKQYAKVKQGHDRVRDLRDAFQSAD